MGKDSGSSQPSTQTVNSTNLPEYARPYFERLMGRAEGVSNQPYSLYRGPRIAGFNQDQKNAFSFARNLPSSYAPAQGISQLLTTTAATNLNTPGYQAQQYVGDYTPTTFTPDQVTAQQVTPGQLPDPQMFDQSVADQYMSPYISSVLDAQRTKLLQDFNDQNLLRKGEAARSGAFGGGRQGVAEGVATGRFNTTLADIYNTGLQSAYENAQQQFQRDRDARTDVGKFNIETMLKGDLANQDAGLRALLANQSTNLEAQRLGDASRLAFGDQALRGFGMNEEARQKQDALEVERATQMGGLASLLSQQSNSALQGNLSILDALRDVGLQQQQLDQASLDLAYNDFINQRDYDRQNVQFLSSILRGVPISANSNVSNFENTNPYSQLLGQGINALALNNALGGSGAS